jgi:AMP deaminase
MGASLQRLGDNPRDHDAAYIPLNRDTCDVASLRPDTTETQWDEMVVNSASTQSGTNPWKVYPPPPPPHWHPSPKDDKPAANPESRKHVSGNEEFNFAECDIPGADQCEYALDDKGVFQVYASSSGIVSNEWNAFFA